MLDADQAESYLASLEPIGWRLGLRRMKALCEQLGNPQLTYATVHVVGTNGKTSVCRMLEGLLRAGGLAAGSSVSPHLTLWRERISIAGETVSAPAFAQATGRVRQAVAVVDGELGDEEGRLTQFEVATAVAFVALAEAGVEVAAIEAGLGGRLDASNVLDSQLTVLTSVGLDHVEWLGGTEQEIAGEKLAVLRPGTTLLVGPVAPPVRELARRQAAERGAELIESGPESGSSAGTGKLAPGMPAAVLPGRFRRLDFEIALRAASFVFGQLPQPAGRIRLDSGAAAAIVADLEIPGRLEVWPGARPVAFDVAHNPQGAAALADALPEVAGGRPVAACLALLADKDADGFVAELAPALDSVICTELAAAQLRGSGRPGARSHPAADLAARFNRQGKAAEAIGDPEAALRRLGELAGQRRVLALVTGSHSLVALARDRQLWQH